VLRAGLKLLREVAAQPSLTRFCGRETGPGADRQTDVELDSYIRGTGGTAHHPCGTCRMGVDPEAVVNPNLQVNGIAGLRVADASVMPDIVGGNINATVIMIAEKSADMIRGVDPKANVTAPTY
jgi:choline dehydrogenase-like flavoprotein